MIKRQEVKKKQKYSNNSIFFMVMAVVMGLVESFLLALIINNSVIFKKYDSYPEGFDRAPKDFFVFSIVIAVILMVLFGFTLYLTLKLLFKRKQEGTL